MRKTATIALRRCFLLHMPSISRGIPLAALAVLSVVSFAATAQAAPPVNGKQPAGAGKASVKLAACKSASRYDARKLEFKGSMNSIGAGGKMEMRFTLYRRYYERKRFSIVKAAPGSGLNEWLASSDSAATIYIHNLTVAPVETRALYRVKVRYRWLDADGNTVASAKRTSRLCSQTRALPDLIVRSIAHFPNAGPDFPQLPTMYEAEVYNMGRSSAAVFTVAGDLNGLHLTMAPATNFTGNDALPAKTARKFVFYGPECAKGGRVTVEANPEHVVRESRYANSVSLNC